MPKERKYANDRAPKLEEIKRITEYPDRRIKSVIYTMVSSGMRLGAWDYLRWKDIVPIIRDGKVIAAKIKIYSEEEDEYFSFITPEAFHSLDTWMKADRRLVYSDLIYCYSIYHNLKKMPSLMTRLHIMSSIN
jgi:hypothetical protein